MSGCRILSLDGGGGLAGILAKALGKLYGPRTPGRDIIRQFDVIAGNSGGSIVMTALCCNYTPSEIEAFYSDPATLRRMFSPRWTAALPDTPLLRILFPPYSVEGKFTALKDMFDRNRQPGEPDPSTIRMEDWPKYLGHDVDLVVTAYDYDRERAAFFRSNPRSRAKSSAAAVAATLAEAVHASTNAPILYYGKPAVVDGRRYWDGALAGYNNPILAAVVEALANRTDDTSAIRALSIGTFAAAQPLTSEGATPPLGKALASTCPAAAIRKAASAIFGDPPAAASFHAYVALRQPIPAAGETGAAGNLVRLCPMVRPLWNQSNGEWELPAALSADEFSDLIHMKLDAMTPRALGLAEKMSNLWIADALPNEPIRMGDHLRCDIGHDRFSAAAAHWKALH